MSDVQFEENNFQSESRYVPPTKTPMFVSWLFKLGVKSERVANGILVGISLVTLVIAVTIFLNSSV